MLDLPTAVALSCLPGALGAALLRTFRARPTGASDSSPTFDLETELRAVCDPARAAASLARARRAAEPLVRDVGAGRRTALIFGAPGYPPLLGEIPDPPPLIWVSGDPAALLGTGVAVVGSRAASPLSLEVASTMAQELAAAGLVVVSGLARGIDAAAHEGALAGGRTVAVLGSGLDRMYPPEHAALARRISATGALVSELPPGIPPRKDHFPRRNRLISGLCRAVVVIEASLRSGSLITARLALDQGRDVMAVPGPVLGNRHRGANALIRDGAPLVECAADVLELLGLTAGAQRGARDDADVPDARGGPLLGALPPGEPRRLDELVAETGLDPPGVMAELTRLELAGSVVRLPGGRFLRASGAMVR